MSFWMIAVVTLLYAVSSDQQVMNGRFGLALFLGGCSIANVGIMLMTREAG